MSIKKRIEALEKKASPDKKIIVIRRFDEPNRKADTRTNEELEAEYPEAEYQLIIVERKEMDSKFIDIDEELDF